MPLTYCHGLRGLGTLAAVYFAQEIISLKPRFSGVPMPSGASAPPEGCAVWGSWSPSYRLPPGSCYWQFWAPEGHQLFPHKWFHSLKTSRRKRSSRRLSVLSQPTPATVWLVTIHRETPVSTPMIPVLAKTSITSQKERQRCVETDRLRSRLWSWTLYSQSWLVVLFVCLRHSLMVPKLAMHLIAKDDSKLMIFLNQSPTKYRNYRHVPSCLILWVHAPHSIYPSAMCPVLILDSLGDCRMQSGFL